MPSKALDVELLFLTLPLLIPKLGPQGSVGSCPSPVQLGTPSWRRLWSEPGPGNAYLQALLILVHEVGQDGRTAATDAQGGKDQDDRVKLAVDVCKRKEGWGVVCGSFPCGPELL